MPLRRFLAMSVALIAVVGLTVFVNDQLDLSTGGGDQVVSGSTAGEDGPSKGQVEVHGALAAALIAGAVLEPRDLPTPLTITSERGFGNGGELTTVEVDGDLTTIVWDGGTPFSLSSGGVLLLDPVNLALVPAGLQAVLGDGNHALEPGTYQLDTPVAVGGDGVATPRDSVTFVALEGTLFEARGDASVIFGPDAPRRFVGPGKVLLGGTFEITDADGTRAATAVASEVSAFDLTFTPRAEGGWTVDGVVEQAVAS